MTIHERMVARSEREKDLLKYGRSQERERIIDLLKELLGYGDEDWDECVCAIIAAIKREN